MAWLGSEDSAPAEMSRSHHALQESSALHAVRQNLAMTAKDVSELRQEVMNEAREKHVFRRRITCFWTKHGEMDVLHWFNEYQ